MQVNLRDSVTSPASRDITVPLGKELKAENQALKPVDTILGKTKEAETQLPENTKEPTWVGILSGNRPVVNGMPLHYITPEAVEGNLVAKLDKSDLKDETLKWKCALIIYAIGFQSVANMKTILCEGPYTVNNRPMIMKQWSQLFDFDAEFLTKIPLWVIFPKLPMNCWGGTSLSRITSTIGIPLLDECTAKQTRISYARILIEVNVTKPLPNKVPIMDDSGNVFDQEMKYDWKPEFCGECLKFGYDCTKIRKKEVKQIQQPKRIRPQPMKQVWKTTGVVLAPTHKSNQEQPKMMNDASYVCC
uniref:DUF4283 domain-containing protein n=1 Tax=Nicotiana tabacum TaxID=4097 RepID=A0A1S3ZFE5_TOBAC|nr:PREDICTED: uncharacterized protein LOC107786085 [Nicotiana tabacum]